MKVPDPPLHAWDREKPGMTAFDVRRAKAALSSG